MNVRGTLARVCWDKGSGLTWSRIAHVRKLPGNRIQEVSGGVVELVPLVWNRGPR